MLSPKTKRNLSRIIPFAAIWVFFSMVYTLVERGLLGRTNIYPATGNPYSFTSNLYISPITTLVMGLLIGSIEILLLNKLFRKTSFGKKIIFKSAIYLVFITVFLLLLSAIGNTLQLKTSFFDETVWEKVWIFFSNYAFLSIVVYIAAIVVVSLFYNEVSESIGHGVLNNFFTGKYHKPLEEERIFMFLDMRSSTTIAENLGHIRYFEMLKEYYSDISDPIVDYSGEVYQYAGDEIIVSWTTRHGLSEGNCIRCFFSMEAAMNMQAAKYQQRFGLIPAFKAGLHVGKVTTGEIGEIKKEIFFTGDVLNTTARIQALCNSYKVDILISGDLKKQLDLPPQFQITPMGETELRGREEKVELFTINQL